MILQSIENVWKNSGGLFDIDQKKTIIQELEKQTYEPDFWNDREAAQKLLKKISTRKRKRTGL